MARGQMLRYWFDGDDASQQTISSATKSWSIEVDVSALADYVHALHVQVCDTAGVWGGVATRYFLKVPAISVTEETRGVPAVLRYWFDGDDANAKQTTLADGMVSIDADIAALGDYVHALHVQVQNDNGTWGGVATRYFVKMPEINIKQETRGTPAVMRYWFDGDDANAKQISMTDGMVSIDADIAALSDYVHALHVQVQNDDGKWGGVATRYFLKAPVVKEDTVQLATMHVVYQLGDTIPHSQSVSLVDGRAVFSIPVDTLATGEHTINYFFVNNQGERTEDMTATFEVVDWPVLADVQGVKYVQADSTATTYTVWGYTEDVNGHVEIPATFQGLPVTSIYEGAFLGSSKLRSIVVPQTVTEVGKDLFLRAGNLLAVEWNSPADIKADCFNPSSQNGNLLVYVQADANVQYAGNVIRDGKISQLVLSDNKPMRVLKPFHADRVSYTRHFSKPTHIGESAGWETLVLPFDVQTVRSETAGELTPIAISQKTDHPYWLAEMGSDGNFTPATAIKANVPYIIAMPNSPEYYEEYNVTGKVIFTALDAEVKPNTPPAATANRHLKAAYETVDAADSVFVVNDEDYTPQTGGDTYYAGSVFVRNLRDVRPFEAYLTLGGGNSKERMFIPIEAPAYTDIRQVMLGHSATDAWQDSPVYDLTGRKVADSYADFLHISSSLQSGVYIVGKRKVLVR